jgi:ATP-dependent DNA ligase
MPITGLAWLDGAVVAFTAAGRPQPFQVTMSRFGRWLDVEAQRAKTSLTPVFFDLPAWTRVNSWSRERSGRLARANSSRTWLSCTFAGVTAKVRMSLCSASMWFL